MNLFIHLSIVFWLYTALQSRSSISRIFSENLQKLRKPFTRVISKQLDIKLVQFTLEELESVLRKIKIEKQQGLMKYPQKYGRQGNWLTEHTNATDFHFTPHDSERETR